MNNTSGFSVAKVVRRRSGVPNPSTGFIMKLLGKDLLNSKYNKNKKTYWITQNKLKGSMKQQF